MSLEGVSKRFQLDSGREIEVLKDMNLSVHEGEIIALLGPSGCGKTTTLKIMSGLLEPSEGNVCVKDKPLTGVNPLVSMVFQNPSLLPWYTVEQNVELGLKYGPLTPKKIQQEVDACIELTSLGGFEEAYPRELSGGLKQRVALARALAVRPEILCLDEPFTSLDGLTAEDLRGEVVDLWEDQSAIKTVVLVTHNIIEAVFMAQKVYVLGADPGHVRAVIHNPLPYPREPRSQQFQELVDKIHAVITEALIPEEEEEKRPAKSQPPWYQGLENIPPVGPGEIVGLLEVLEDFGGKMDIFKLAVETRSEFGHCLAVIKTTELLDFIDTPKQTVVFTALGKKFMNEEGPDRKDIFSEQIKTLRIFQTLLAWLEESDEHEITREEVIERLQTYFPNEKLEQLFDTVVSLGRYAEIISYNAKLGVLTFPEEEEEEESDAEDEN